MHNSIHSLWSVVNWLHFEEFWEVSVVVVKNLLLCVRHHQSCSDWKKTVWKSDFHTGVWWKKAFVKFHWIEKLRMWKIYRTILLVPWEKLIKSEDYNQQTILDLITDQKWTVTFFINLLFTNMRETLDRFFILIIYCMDTFHIFWRPTQWWHDHV